MIKGTEKAPAIRFRGFTDDWERRKLSEMVIRYEDPIVTPHDGYTRLGIRSHAKGTFYEYVAPGHELETAQMHRVAADKLIFNITFAWEHAVAITTKDDAGKLVSHRFPQFTLSESLRPEFLKYIILDEGFHHNLYLASPGGAGRNRVLKIDEALDYPICFPSFEEQHKIGEFLNKLSNLITLHQRKLELMKKLKAFFLQNMFPEEGETVPRIRFKGFTGDWEQRKLGEMAESFQYGLNAAAKKYDGKNKYIRITDIDDISHEFLQSNLTSPDTDISQADNYRLNEGNILFARTGASVGKTYIYKHSDGRVYYAGFLIRAKLFKEYDPEFVFQNTLTSKYKRFIQITSQRSGQPGVNAQEYEDYGLMVPSLKEQKGIGTFLANLDNLITLHQRKLDQLQNVKKFMLQNLFI